MEPNTYASGPANPNGSAACDRRQPRMIRTVSASTSTTRARPDFVPFVSAR